MSKEFKSYIILRYIFAFFQFIINVALVRILDPSIFGKAAILIVLFSIFSIFGQMGLGPTIIQNKLSIDETSKLFKNNLLIGQFFSILSIITVFILDYFYSYNLNILGYLLFYFGLILNIYSMIPSAYLRSLKKLKTVMSIELTSILISGMISIFLALIVNNIIVLIFNLFLYNIINFIIKFRFSKLNVNVIGKINFLNYFKQSKHQYFNNIFDFSTKNNDTLLLGTIVSSENLAYYDQAYKLIRLPTNNFVTLITQFLHPYLRDYPKKELYRIYIFLSKTIMIFGLFLTLFIYYFNNEIILLLYGKNWIESASLFKMFSATLIFTFQNSLLIPFFQVFKRVKLFFQSNLVYFIMMFLIFAILNQFTNELEYYIIGILGMILTQFIILNYFLCSKLFNIQLINFFKKIGVILLIFIFNSIVFFSLIELDLYTFLTLFIVEIILIYFNNRNLIKELRRIVLK